MLSWPCHGLGAPGIAPVLPSLADPCAELTGDGNGMILVFTETCSVTDLKDARHVRNWVCVPELMACHASESPFSAGRG